MVCSTKLSRFCILLLAAAGWLSGNASAQAGLTPQSPEIRAAVERAKNALVTTKYVGRTVGYRALTALALVKSGLPKDHGYINQTLEMIKTQYQTLPAPAYTAVYDTSVCIILLCALDPVTYQREIKALLDYLLSLQRPFGSFSSPNLPTADYGDTSMTQYAILAFWEAEKAGVAVPTERWQLATNWLLRTQTGGGGFAYNPERISPVEPSHSMTAGGLGSCYIAAARAGVTKAPVKPETPSLPSALQPVVEKRPPAENNKLGVNTEALQNALQRGDAWMAARFQVEVEGYLHYYHYSFERYSAFREYVEQRPSPEPAWYDEIARYLLAKQNPDGSWGSQENTSFAILFLVRSTKQSLQAAEVDLAAQGVLIGGRGLPLGAKELEMRSAGRARR